MSDTTYRQKTLTESEWKQFRQVLELALERFCQRTLSEMVAKANEPAKSHHQRYGEVNLYLRERDRELSRTFDDVRRSTAFFQLAFLYEANLLEDEELARFRPETIEA